MVAVIVLLLVLAPVVAALLMFRALSGEISASNRRVPLPAKTALVPSPNLLSQPQVILVTFENASLFVRTDPKERLISILSMPSSAFAPTEGGGPQSIGQAYAVAGSAGVIRFARSALGLLTTHVALIEPTQIAPLVEAIGGVHIRDRAYALNSGQAGGGEIDLQGLAARRYLDSAGPPGTALRGERERILLEAIVNRLLDVSTFSKLRRLAHTFSETVATDLSPANTVALALLRLRIKSLIECGTAEGSSLASSRSKLVLRQFLGGLPTRAPGTGALPRSGCRAISASATGVPAAIISIGGSSLGVLPFLPAIATFVIVLDLIMLLMLLRVPQLLARAGTGIGRLRRNHGRPLAGIDEPQIGARDEVSSMSESLANRLRHYEATAREVPARTTLVRGEGEPSPFTQAESVQVVEALPQARVHPAAVTEKANRSRPRSRFGRDRTSARGARMRDRHGLPFGSLRWGIITAKLRLLIEWVTKKPNRSRRSLFGSLRWGIIAASVGLLVGYLVSGRF